MKLFGMYTVWLELFADYYRVYPPVPVGVQRFTPPGSPSIVDGYSIPAGVRQCALIRYSR